MASYLRCAAITRAGERCKLVATDGSYCFSHSPSTAEARKQRARLGGRAGGNGRGGLSETAQAKSYTRALIARLLSGGVKREIATACFQGLNVLARYIELELKVREQAELIERIERLEAARAREGGGSWTSAR